MATSTGSGKSGEAATAGESTVVAQKFSSWMGMDESARRDSSIGRRLKSNCGISAQKKETAVNAGASAVSLREIVSREKTRRRLFFVAVEAVDGRDGAEEAILFAVNAGGEKQSVRGPGVRVIAKRERPQTVNGQDGVIRILHESHEFVGEAIESGNLATAEITDKNGVAELAKVARGPHNRPRRIKPWAILEMADVLAGWREEFNEAKTVTGNVIVAGGVLLRVSDEERAADILNVEGREAVRNFLGIEGIFTEIHALERGVINFDSRSTEVRDVKKFVAIDFSGGCAFVDGAIRGAVIGVIDDEDGVLSAVPAGNRSI